MPTMGIYLMQHAKPFSMVTMFIFCQIPKECVPQTLYLRAKASIAPMT